MKNLCSHISGIDKIVDYLVNEVEYTPSEVEHMSRYEALNAILSYEGMIGFTDLILELVQDIYGVELENGMLMEEYK